MLFTSKRLFVFFSIGLLASCGFHLRGPLELPVEITPLYIEQTGADNALNHELRFVLSESSETNLTQSKDEAQAILNVVSTNKKQRVVAVDQRGRARQYELSFIVHYRVTGKAIPQAGNDNISLLKLRRELSFNPDSVLAIEHEIDTLYKDMRKDSARLILQRLQAQSLKKQDLQQSQPLKNGDEQTSE